MEIHRDDHPEHLAADLHELLAEEAGELGVRAEVDRERNVVALHGAVATAERVDECVRLVERALPGFRVDSRVEVVADEMQPLSREEHL
ncbi:MAG TPA: hypothetical protein VFK42_17190 [Acidimicrobiales bacterium]|jgi:hypothetical protein|nr:hypothetical protein [Acidimicrobiales bacterium]